MLRDRDSQFIDKACEIAPICVYVHQFSMDGKPEFFLQDGTYTQESKLPFLKRTNVSFLTNHNLTTV